MIKGAVLAAALLAGGATAASAEVTFVGTIKITAVTPQCQSVYAGERDNSAFHPKLAGNLNFAGLSWVFTEGARGHSLNNLNFDATFRVVKTGGVGWGDAYTVPVAENAQIKITSYSPPIGSINNTTQNVILKGQVKRLIGDPGGLACVADFLGVYVKDDNQ